MAEIKAYGTNIINCGDTIISLAEEYLITINTFFESYSKLNKTAWSGVSADNYVSKLTLDKKKFEQYGEYIKMYGKVIRNIGVNVDRIVDKWEVKKQDV